MPGITCEYVSSVIPMLACPSCSEMTLGCTPSLRSAFLIVGLVIVRAGLRIAEATFR
jgi:hypothetical protein